MSNTFRLVIITTTQELDRKAIEYYLKNGLLSIKRSGARISIECLPKSEEEVWDLIANNK